MKLRALAVAAVALAGMAMTTTGTEVVASMPHARATVAGATTSPIQHVVVIYQENHSFDNVLGAFCRASVPVRCDGYTGTVSLRGGVRVPLTVSGDIVPGVSHTVKDQQAAIDGGKMDGWAHVLGCSAAYRYACLTYYIPAQIPNLAALATKFAVSDRTFSMADSPSWGGHLYAAAARLDGFTGDNPRPAAGVKPGPGWGCDSNKQTLWSPNGGVTPFVVEPSCVPKPDGTGAYKRTPVPYVHTIFDSLDAAKRTYRIYGAPVPATVGGKAGGYGWSICPSFAECRYGSQSSALVPSGQILTDATSGRLPNYSVVTPSWSSRQANNNQATSQHNHSSMLAGDNWIGKVFTALASGPEWNSTAIFIVYDDCGCFYDHVSPGRNPDGSLQGPRVPMVIVSPYARARYTDSTMASFASILRFTEETFGLAPLSVNDAKAYDYRNAFNYAQVPLTPVPMVTSRLPAGSSGLVDAANDPTKPKSAPECLRRGCGPGGGRSQAPRRPQSAQGAAGAAPP